jgi:hypothetical protein
MARRLANGCCRDLAILRPDDMEKLPLPYVIMQAIRCRTADGEGDAMRVAQAIRLDAGIRFAAK